MKIIHITDLHLPEPGSGLWGLDPFERLESALRDIEQWHSNADLCVLSGDLADRGSHDAYAWLAARLQQFPIETVLMIGNHDDRDTMRQALPGLPQDPNGFVQGYRDTTAGRILFLDTFGGETSAGEYCGTRRQWLQERLEEAAGPVWIFMHHPPFDIGIPYMDRIKLQNAAAFRDLLTGHDIRHLFFGHVHRACFVNWNGIACNALPGLNHQVPLVRDTTGTAYSVEPPMYGVILIDADKTVVHLDAFLDRGPADMPQ